MENKIRQTLNEIYFGKTKDIVNDLRWEELHNPALVLSSPLISLCPTSFLLSHCLTFSFSSPTSSSSSSSYSSSSSSSSSLVSLYLPHLSSIPHMYPPLPLFPCSPFTLAVRSVGDLRSRKQQQKIADEIKQRMTLQS